MWALAADYLKKDDPDPNLHGFERYVDADRATLLVGGAPPKAAGAEGAACAPPRKSEVWVRVRCALNDARVPRRPARRPRADDDPGGL